MFFYVSTLFQPLPVHKQFTTPPLSHLSFPFPSLHSRHRPISTPVPLCHTHSSSTISAIASFIRIPLSSNPLPYNVIDWRLFLFRSSPVSPRSSRIPIRFDLIRSRLSLVNIVSYSSGCCAGAFSFLGSVFIPPELSSNHTPLWWLLSDTRSSSPSDSSKVL